MKLTDTLLRSLKATGQVQKKADGGGLYIHVSPSGGKLWRMAYSFDGKQKTFPAQQALEKARRSRLVFDRFRGHHFAHDFTAIF